MQIKINDTTWTQLNTNSTQYLLQNTGNSPVMIVRADTQPTPDTYRDLILTPFAGLQSNVLTGVLWGKVHTGDGEISVLEG